MGDYRVINSCRVAAEINDRLHIAPRSIIVCSSQRAWHHTRSPRKSLPLTTTTTVGGRQKIKHASLSVVRSQGVLDAASVVVHYDTLCEMKRSIVMANAHWWFPSPPDTLRLIGLKLCSLTPTLDDTKYLIRWHSCTFRCKLFLSSILLLYSWQDRYPRTALWYRQMINVFATQPRKLPQYWWALSLAGGAVGTVASLLQPLIIWLLRATEWWAGIVSERGADYQRRGANLWFHTEFPSLLWERSCWSITMPAGFVFSHRVLILSYSVSIQCVSAISSSHVVFWHVFSQEVALFYGDTLPLILILA